LLLKLNFVPICSPVARSTDIPLGSDVHSRIQSSALLQNMAISEEDPRDEELMVALEVQGERKLGDAKQTK
jgi:hypothetical protein